MIKSYMYLLPLALFQVILGVNCPNSSTKITTTCDKVPANEVDAKCIDGAKDINGDECTTTYTGNKCTFKATPPTSGFHSITCNEISDLKQCAGIDVNNQKCRINDEEVCEAEIQAGSNKLCRENLNFCEQFIVIKPTLSVLAKADEGTVINCNQLKFGKIQLCEDNDIEATKCKSTNPSLDACPRIGDDQTQCLKQKANNIAAKQPKGNICRLE